MILDHLNSMFYLNLYLGHGQAREHQSIIFQQDTASGLSFTYGR